MEGNASLVVQRGTINTATTTTIYTGVEDSNLSIRLVNPSDTTDVKVKIQCNGVDWYPHLMLFSAGKNQNVFQETIEIQSAETITVETYTTDVVHWHVTGVREP